MPRNTRIFIYDVDFDDENVANEIEPGDLIEWDNINQKQYIGTSYGPFHMTWAISYGSYDNILSQRRQMS